MVDRRLAVRPLAVALRGEQGSVALFESTMPSECQGKVTVWATCGQRRRFPVPASVTRDETGDCRRLVVSVKMPALYSACTLHVVVRDGLRVRWASSRIPDPLFRELAGSAGNAENDVRYHSWLLAQRLDESALARERERAKALPLRPLISIVTPVYRTPEPFLTAFVSSVLGQAYDNLELIIVNVSGECPEVDEALARFDDGRLRVIEAPNRTIPENTNAGIEAARGDYIGFVDHDDFIEPVALQRYVEAICAQPECDLLFCDEDLWDPDWEGGRFCGARFKPGWNPDLLYTHNYVCHLLMVSRWALERIELSGPEVNGAQDFDLTLKVSEVARAVRHVPGILYHWRRHPGSTASNRESKPYALEAGRMAVQAHFDREGVPAEVVIGSAPFSYRVRYRAAAAREVSLVLVDSASRAGVAAQEAVPALGGEVELLSCGGAHLDEAVAAASGPLVVVLENSVGVKGGEWVDELVRQLTRPGIGCAAPMLVDEDGFVRSAGLLLGSDGVWRHAFDGCPKDDVGYMLMLEHARDVTAVPLRCLAFRKSDYEQVGGFDETLAGDWAAIDFCLRLRERGLLTVLVPYSPVYVAGPLGDVADAASAGRLRTRHAGLAEGDPYLDPFLDQRSARFGLRLDS